MATTPNTVTEKFTRGDWHVGPQNGVYDKDGNLIADVPEYGREEAVANAHLIAAAPDLYAALKPFAALFDKLDDGQEGCEPIRIDPSDGLTLAHFAAAAAALSRALGEP